MFLEHKHSTDVDKANQEKKKTKRKDKQNKTHFLSQDELYKW